MHIVREKPDNAKKSLRNHSLYDVIETLKRDPNFYKNGNLNFKPKANCFTMAM